MTPETWEELNQKYKVITYSQESKKMDTNPIRGWLVQGENQTTAVAIVGPPKIKSISLQNLRMAIRISSEQYETTVEKTLDETQLIDEETYMMLWIVGKEETAVPGNISVSLIGYGGDEEVIKISSDGITIKADDLEGQAPPESTWQKILSEVQAFAAQAAQSKDAAEQAKQTAIEKASEALASAGTAAQKAAEAIAAASTAAADAAALAAAQTEEEIKGFADDRYAHALVVTEGPAASLTIYPDAGSNIAITSHGYTEQSGTLDPSPINVRPIKVGGMILQKKVITGLENGWREAGAGTHKYYACLVFDDIGGTMANQVFIKSSYLPSKLQGELENGASGVTAFNNTIFVKSDGVKSLQEQLEVLKKENLVVWYQNNEKTGKLYTTQITEGKSYKCECIELSSGLCKDDTAKSGQKSECDSALVFDGSSDETWVPDNSSSLDLSGSKRFMFLKGISPKSVNTSATGKNLAYSNYLEPRTPTETYYTGYPSSFSLQGEAIHVRIPGISTEEALRRHLQANPLVVTYKSVDYTDEKEKNIAAEVRVRHKHTLTSKDTWKSGGGSGTDQYYCALPFTPKTGDEICTHYKRSTSAGTANSFQCTGASVYIRTEAGAFASLEDWKAHLDSEEAAGKPVEVEYQIANAITLAHDGVFMIADPKTTDGSVKITGEKTVSATHNKSLKKAFEELKAVVLAFGAGLKE